MRTGNSQKGVAAVEFAILLVPLLMMVFGITEFGRAMYQYDALAKGVRNAVRYLSTQSAGENHTLARNLALCGKDDCSGSAPLAPNLLGTMIIICDGSNSSGGASPAADCQDQSRGNVPTGSEQINLTTVRIQGFVFMSVINFVANSMQVGTPNITFGAISNTMRQTL